MEVNSPDTDLAIQPSVLRWRGFWVVLFGLGLYWLALPPVGAWPLGWIVFAPWTIVVCGSESIQPGKGRLWLASWLFWLAAMYFIPIPHPALWIAWPLLSGYMALYPVAFFLISRRLVKRTRWPAVFVMPAVWVSLEWVRGWMITGFSMGMLAHTQFRQPLLIQLANIAGDFLVSFSMATFGVGIGMLLFVRSSRRELNWAVPTTVGMVAIVGGWGWFCLSQSQNAQTDSPPTGVPAIVVQGSIDTILFGPDQAELQEEWLGDQRAQYRRLTLEARQKWPEARLAIWPEGIFSEWVVLDDPTAESQDPQLTEYIRLAPALLKQEWGIVTGISDDPLIADWVASENRPIALLTGVPSGRVLSREQYNSAVLIDETGSVANLYKKNHRVIFGEYLPLTDWFPIIDQWSPIGRGLDRGLHAAAFRFEGLVLMPEICFETTLPHLIRRHWIELETQGSPPDYLVCVTNDGWFFGTSCLDLHLACSVFRSVETGTPMLVSANTGFSAEIDATGRILQQGPRRATGTLLARLHQRTSGRTGYIHFGDWPWVAASLVILIGCMVGRRFGDNPVE